MSKSRKWLLAGLGVVLALAAAGYYMLDLERDPAELALGAPVALADLDLLDPEGRRFDPGSLGAGRLPVLLFYRGYW